MSMPDEAPCTPKARMIVNALVRDGYDLSGAQLFMEDIDEVDRLYAEMARNQLAESRLGRVVEAAKQCKVIANNPPAPEDPDEPKNCWAVKLFDQIHAFEQHHIDAIKTAMTQRRALWTVSSTT